MSGSLFRRINQGKSLSPAELVAFKLCLYKDFNNCEDIYLTIDVEKGKSLSEEVAVALSEWRPMSNLPAHVTINVEQLSDGAAQSLALWRILDDSCDQPNPRFDYHGFLYLTELRSLSERASRYLLASKSFLVINPSRLDPLAVEILSARNSERDENGDLRLKPLPLKNPASKRSIKRKNTPRKP